MRQNSEEDFEHLSKEAAYWLNKAVALRAAAGAIWYCTEVEPIEKVIITLAGNPPVDFSTGSWQVYRMLCGMSIELMYKAVIVQNKKTVPKTHNLLELAHKAGDFTPSPKDAGLLALLTECIMWEGRYPVPHHHSAIDWFAFLHYENLFRKVPTGKSSMALEPIEPNPLDWEQYNQLWEHAHALFVFMND